MNAFKMLRRVTNFSIIGQCVNLILSCLSNIFSPVDGNVMMSVHDFPGNISTALENYFRDVSVFAFSLRVCHLSSSINALF